MGVFEVATILVVLSAVLSFINARYVGLPTTIGVMIISLCISLVLVAMRATNLGIEDQAEQFLAAIQFDEALLKGMLGFLLFAGALHVNINDLAKQKWVIGLLATVGVIASTLIVGGAVYVMLGWLGYEVSLLMCFLFGALITPTDPIAVLGIMKTVGAPKTLETKISGESLFNDGIGVVVFLVLLSMTGSGHGGHAAETSLGSVAQLFFVEAAGGVLLGLGLGLVGYWMLRQVDNYQVEVLLSLALVMGGYSLAGSLHTSGPIAIVVCGLMIGNHGRTLAMSETTREHLDTFWELVDEILNAVLFVLIGLELLIIPLEPGYILAGILAIPIALAARGLAVGTAVTILRRFRTFTNGAARIITWAGLRGGLSIAMALSLPAGPERSLFLTMSYCVVLFSIIVQGLTVGPLVRRLALGRT